MSKPACYDGATGREDGGRCERKSNNPAPEDCIRRPHIVRRKIDVAIYSLKLPNKFADDAYKNF